MPVTPSYTVRLRNHAHDLDANAHLPAEVLSAVSTDTTKVLAPDGAGGVHFVSPSGGSGSSLPWYNVKTDGTCVGDGVTDDTVALQAAITAATASGTKSATLYFPAGTYLLGGALQDTGAFNGQILLPNVSTASAQITVTFKGAARPPFAVHGSLPAPGGYSILKSSLTGASGTAAVISGGNGTWPTQNNVSVVIEDLICLSPDNPSMSWWNLTTCQGGAIRSLFVTVVTWTTCSQPTHSNAYGVKLPQWGQSNHTEVDGLCVGGHYTGLLQGELTTAAGLIFGLCVIGIELPFTEHPSLIVSMEQTACGIGILLSGDHYADIVQYASEHYTTPAWAVTSYDLSDASNHFYGNIRWWGVAVGGTPDHVFLVNGASHATYSELGSAPAGLSFATPAIVLGTAAATGSAGTIIRSDATIAAFDATSPTTSAIGDAAATGSAAKAARRDHVHGREALSTATPLVESGSGATGTGTKNSREDHVHPAVAVVGTDHQHIGDIQFNGDGVTTAFELPAAPFDAYSVQAYVAGVRLDVVLSGTLLTTMTFGSAPASGTNNIIVDVIAVAA